MGKGLDSTLQAQLPLRTEGRCDVRGRNPQQRHTSRTEAAASLSREEIISTNNFEELQTNPAGKNSIGKASPKPLETRQTEFTPDFSTELLE